MASLSEFRLLVPAGESSRTGPPRRKSGVGTLEREGGTPSSMSDFFSQLGEAVGGEAPAKATKPLRRRSSNNEGTPVSPQFHTASKSRSWCRLHRMSSCHGLNSLSSLPMHSSHAMQLLHRLLSRVGHGRCVRGSLKPVQLSAFRRRVRQRGRSGCSRRCW